MSSLSPDANLLTGAVAVVTGASSGIGKAIALALAQRGALLCAVGRNAAALRETVTAAQCSPRAGAFPADLTVDENIERLAVWLKSEFGRVDILVHSAGIIHHGRMRDAGIDRLDLHYATNLRAPYLLTQALLPFLTTSRGQVVFVNSSAGLAANRPEIGPYAATKHALKAIADSLRSEVNPDGVRVLTVYLGRSATPMQQHLLRQEGKPYHPERLLQPEDAASVIVHALALPRTAEVTDISIRPMIANG